MRRVKRRIFCGAVCEQEVYTVSGRVKDVKHAEPGKPRFETEEDRILHRELISKRRHVRLVNANFSPTSLYSTLTFDEENECHDHIDCRIIRDRFFRKLKRKYPDAVIFIYMGQGKSTHRYHIHMLSEGIPKKEIMRMWEYGAVSRIEHLRKHCRYDGVDHGQDYTGLADYLWRHWKPEYGGHHWKMTRNARQPEKENAKEIKREYSQAKPPKAPKGYMLIETYQNQYGYQLYRYVRIPDPDPHPPGKSRRTEPAAEA